MSSSSDAILGEVLKRAFDLPWEHALYLPFNEKWSLETRGCVLDPALADDEERISDSSGLDYVLSIQQIQSIIRNVSQQRSEVDDTELLAAFLYYYDNDAFIDLSAVSRP